MRINLALPVFNEEKVLYRNTGIIYNFLRTNFNWNFDVIIADNKSTDATPLIAKKLCGKYKHLRYLFVNEKGRGKAIRTAWLKFPADVYAYMDIDLSTDLKSFPNMIKQVRNGYDIVIGSRYLRGSHANRTLLRYLLSKTYNSYIKFLFHTKIHDLQCGFKAVDKKVVHKLLSRVKDNGFFSIRNS